MSELDEEDLGEEADRKRPINKEEMVLQNLMRTEDNRRYVFDKLQEFGVFDDTFVKDPIEHAHRAGMRAAGLAIEKDLKGYVPERYMQMLKENIG